MSRRITAFSLVAAGIVTLAGLLATTWESERTTESMLQAMGQHPAQAQIAAVLLYLGYLLMVPAVFGLLSALREWGGRFRAIGGTLAVVGWGTLPGMLVLDFYDLAIVQRLPIDQAVGVEDAAQGMAGAAVIGIAGAIPAILGLTLLLVAARRARIVALWVPVLMVVSVAVPLVVGLDLVGIGIGGVLNAIVLCGAAHGVLRAGRTEAVLPDPDFVREPVAA